VEPAVDLVEHDVVGVGLEQVGGQLPGPVDQLHRRLVHRGAAQLQGARAHGAVAALDQVGVAVDHPDLLDGDAQLLAGHHGERGVQALPVGRGPGVDGGGPVGADLDLAVLAGPDGPAVTST
jgi:hypothetical protein